MTVTVVMSVRSPESGSRMGGVPWPEWCVARTLPNAIQRLAAAQVQPAVGEGRRGDRAVVDRVLGELLELRPRRGDGAEAGQVQEVDAALGDDRRRLVLARQPFLPLQLARQPVRAVGDAHVGD